MTDGAAAPARQDLRTNVRWNLVGLAAYAAGQWLQLVVLARLGGAAAVGAYSFALALTGPAITFASLHLRMLQASDATEAYPFQAYRRLRALTTVAAVLGVAVVAAATGADRSGWSILVPVCAMRAADAMSDIYYGLWQQRERMKVIGAGLTLNAASSLAFMTAFGVLGGGVAGAAAGSALGSVAALAFVHARTAADPALRAMVARGAPPPARRMVKRLALEAAPLGVILLLSSLRTAVPQYFLRHFGGEAVLGVFAATLQLTATGNVVVGALGQAASPRLAALHAARDVRAFRALTARLVGVGLLLGVAGVALSLLVGREVLTLLYGGEFASGQRVLVVLSVAAAASFLATLLGDVLTTARIIAFQPAMLTAAVGVLVLACVLLVPGRGGMGAGIALAAAYAVQTGVSAAALRWVGTGASTRPALG